MRRGKTLHVPRRSRRRLSGNISLSHTPHPSLLSNPRDCGQIRPLGKDPPYAVSTSQERHGFGNLSPRQPTHFNEPWPTALTEPFSHVKCAATAGPGWPKLPPPWGTSPSLVTTACAPNQEHRFPAALRAPGDWAGGAPEPWQHRGRRSVLEERRQRRGVGRERGARPRAGSQTSSAQQPCKDVLKCKVICSCKARNVSRC